MASCEMKGLLSFILLWLIHKRPMTGADLTGELLKRKGTPPSPGTIYPALKYLRKKQLVKTDQKKAYVLTAKGRKELHELSRTFFSIFCDVEEMKQYAQA